MAICVPSPFPFEDRLLKVEVSEEDKDLQEDKFHDKKDKQKDDNEDEGKPLPPPQPAHPRRQSSRITNSIGYLEDQEFN